MQYAVDTSPTERGGGAAGLGVIAAFAALKLALHLAVNATGGYGIFRDELYYLACAAHPAAGYVDQPPFSIFLLGASRFLFGDSLFALRLLPALTGSATVFLTGLAARELGGGRFAQTLACLASILSLFGLAIGSIYTMNAFDALLWMAAFLVVVRIIHRGAPRLWLLLGLILGIGLLNKIGVFWLCAGLAVGFAATPLRRWLRTPWPYAAAGIAFLCFLPYVIWNVQNDFAHLEFIRNATGGKYAGITFMDFLSGQFLLQNPVTFFVWIAGLLWLLRDAAGRGYRVFGIVFLTSFAILAINGHSKAEYLSSSYGVLFAAGGIAIERLSAGRILRRFRPAALLLLVLGFAFAPATLPCLPVETFIGYAETLGIVPGTNESKELAELPQLYADMFGWEDKARAVGGVYNSLSAEDRRQCAIFADNYGRCGAIDYFGPSYGLPNAIGGHNNYYLWGSRGYTGSLVLVMRRNADGLREVFARVDSLRGIHSRYCMPYENDLSLFLCRGLKQPLSSVWPTLKHYE